MSSRAAVVNQAAGCMYAVVTACGLSSCSADPQPNSRQEVIVSGLSRPSAIAVAGEFLVVADEGELLVYSRRDGKFLRGAGRPGSGPGEFGAIWSMQGVTGPRGAAVWVFDNHLMRFSEFSLFADSVRYTGRSVPVHAPGLPLGIQWTTDSSFVVAGYFSEARLFVSDGPETRPRAVGAIPQSRDSSDAFVLQQAFQPTIAVRPGDQLAAVAARYAGRLDIHDLRSGGSVSARVPMAFSPELRVATRGNMPVFVTDHTTRFGYVAVAATSELVYAIFSGRTRGDSPGRAHLGSQLHVFDWDGVLVLQAELGRDLLDVAVDSADTELYGLVAEDTPSVARFVIRELFEQTTPGSRERNERP